MGMLKFAYSSQVVMDAFTEDTSPKYNPNSIDSKQAGLQFANTVKQAKQVIKKSGDFLYVRTRAIGSLEKWGPNMNGDGFPMKELAASYGTFVGKGNFIDHKSDDINMIRGLVVDAYLNNEDHCVECLIAVDKKSHPQLARDIETGVVNSVSMGTRVGWSECSVCANVARTERDYCSHIQNYKGMKIGFLTNNENHKFGSHPVHEVNHELEFIELSWVSVPAFKDAYVLEKIASLKKGVENGFKEGDYTKANNGFSDAEMELAAFIEGPRVAPEQVAYQQNIPVALQGIASAAMCQDTECSYDARRNAPPHYHVATPKATPGPIRATAADMNRIRITREEVNFRTAPKDFGAKGNIVIDGKDYKWWGSSADKQNWTISLDEDLMSLSANGQKQVVDAIADLLHQNIDNTELIVASVKGQNIREGYLQGGVDPLISGGNVAKPVMDGKSIYNNKDLAVPVGEDSREYEQKTFEETAKEGPSGALGKPLKKDDETMKASELKYKEELKRAYVDFKFKNIVKGSK